MVFTAASLLGARNIVIASIVFVPGLARGLADIGTVTGEERRPIFRPMAAVLALAGVLAAVVAASGPVYNLNGYPVAAVTWAEREGLLGPDARLVSQDYVGNYLEARYGTAAKVFIDDRYDMFPETVVNDFLGPQSGQRRAGRKCSIATRRRPCSGPSTNLSDSSWPSPRSGGWSTPTRSSSSPSPADRSRIRRSAWARRRYCRFPLHRVGIGHAERRVEALAAFSRLGSARP